MIAGYNDPKGAAVHNLYQVFAKSIAMFGFIVWRLEDKYNKEFYENVPLWVSRGELKHKEQIFEGLDKTGEVILAVQEGDVHGKAVIKVASDEV